MAKSIVEKHSKSLVGIIDVRAMTMELEDNGIKDLKDLLSKFDGQYVTINISLKSEPEE